jgi:hypothetical protein
MSSILPGVSKLSATGGPVKLTINRNTRRGALAVVAAGVATAASLAVLPASSALAATGACKSFTVGGVSFSLCTERVSSTRGRARIIVTGGTYAHGTLYLETSNGTTDSGCTSKIYTGSECSFSETRGSGNYQTSFYPAGGGIYSSPGLLIS